jgi:hypothetical protein
MKMIRKDKCNNPKPTHTMMSDFKYSIGAIYCIMVGVKAFNAIVIKANADIIL